MSKVKVLVVNNIGEERLRQISDVGPEIEVMDASRLWVAPDPFIPNRKEDSRNPKFSALLSEAEVIYGLRFPEKLIERAPRLRWIQGQGTGVKHVLTNEVVKSRVTVTNISTLRATPMAELTFSLIMMLAKQAPLLFRSQQRKKWQRFSHVMLQSKTLGVVGLGRIGKGVARLAHAFGMKVIGTRRSAPGKTRPRYVDEILKKELLPRLLTESDFVVLSIPDIPETYKLIGERELKAMKPTAYLINVARGSALDEEALIHALEENWIAGAALDVYTKEPLPSHSKLWALPNVIISPHVGGEMVDALGKTTEFFCENLRRYINGKRLLDIVDKKMGY